MPSLFISYSHANDVQRDQLQKHFAVLRREGVLDVWHDHRLLAGDEIDSSISGELEKADIILFLVSPDFLASDYCYDIEMKRSLERHEAGEARAISVILEPCDWQKSPLGKFLALPENGNAVSKFPNPNDAYLEVVRQIRRVLDDLGVSTQTATSSAFGNARPKLSKPVKSAPRTSNLAVRKEFTDRDRDRFLRETFEYVQNFFENSLKELETRNEDIETDFRVIDANHFTAEIYRGGNRESSCTVSMPGNRLAGSHSITYTTSTTRYENSYEDALSLVEGEQALGFRSLDHFSLGRQQRSDEGLSQQGASEHFWSRLIQPLQK